MTVSVCVLVANVIVELLDGGTVASVVFTRYRLAPNNMDNATSICQTGIMEDNSH